MTTSAQRTTYGDEELPHLLSRMSGDEKHDPASQSTLDVLWVLYHDVLLLSPERLDDPDRDRFYLSKGHGPMAFYAILAAHGYLPVQWLDDWTAFDSPLGAHPDRTLIPGCEISAGSLGHGLPLAVGTALGLRAQHRAAHVYVLVGDAELDEGSNDEAIAFAGATGLDNLTVVAIDNSSSTYNRPGRLQRRFEVERWSTTEIDGHDHRSIRSALIRREGRPSFIAALVESKGR
ncbi:MAG: transketolase [Nakamurella sp.]